ncbi:response regulator, partial [Candidatus Parcubacteria bacterium]
LVVDDEEQFLKFVKSGFEKRNNLNCFVAMNGFDAMRILGERWIDVVLLDLKMPETNGIHVLRKVKKAHPMIEVIMVTGHASMESVVECLKLGAYDYLMKPQSIIELEAKVKEAFDRKTAKEEKLRREKVDKILR